MAMRWTGRDLHASRAPGVRRACALAAIILGAWAPAAMAGGLHADALPATHALPAPTGVESVATIVAPRMLARGPRTVAVVMINFASLPAAPWTPDEARGAVFTGQSSLNAFEREQSGGAITLAGRQRPDGDVFGWYTIPDSTATCDPDAWMASARVAAAAAGVDLSTYQHRIHVFPRVAACGWSGAADMPGGDSFLNGTLTLRVLAHEFGHNLGAEHASALRCVDAAGLSVTFSSSCSTREYGDPYDVMGSGERHPAAFRKAEAGFIPAAGLTTVSQTGTYRLGSSSVLAAGVVSLRVPRGVTGEYWYMEVRSPAGIFENVAADDPSVTGVTVRLAGDYLPAARTRLVDAAPATATFADAPLQLGQVFADPTSGVTVALASMAPGAADVTVTVPGTMPLPNTVIPKTTLPTPEGVKATATLRRISSRRGILRVVVPVTAGSRRCSVRIAALSATRCRIDGTLATRVQTVVLPRRVLPVQVLLDGRVVMSVRLRVPRAGTVTRLSRLLAVPAPS